MSLEATLATWKLTKDQVTAPEKLFLLSCSNRASEEHECWPSVKRMCADTGLSRNALIEIRQRLIDKNLLKYTGEMKGRSGQIPVMRLLYVKQDSYPQVDSTSTKTGTGTSTKTGTGTSTKTGTLNLKEESKRGIKKAFTKKAEKTQKPKPDNPRRSKASYKAENSKKHSFAESKDQMAREAQHIADHEAMKLREVKASPKAKDAIQGIKHLLKYASASSR